MFNQSKHKSVLIQILKDVYSDPEIRTLVGFKGGTAAMLFYHLPRISVDLDFDLFMEEKKELVFEKMKVIVARHGNIYEAVEKRYTLLFVISYENGDRTVKIDISKRKGGGSYEPLAYLGVSMLVMKQEDMLAGKLSALLTRSRFAMRDVYDLWFFLKNKWTINETELKEKSSLSVNEALNQAITKVSSLSKNQLLQGLGDLLDSKQKAWVKEKLVDDLVFQLRLYIETHKQL